MQALAARAALLNIAMSRLCELAGENTNNVFRWMRGKVDPQIGLFGRVMRALESAMLKEEIRVLVALAKQLLPEPLADQVVAYVSQDGAGVDAGAVTLNTAPVSASLDTTQGA